MEDKRSGNGILAGGADKFFLWFIVISSTLLLLFFPQNFISAANTYYYVHIGSFRAKRNAAQTAEKLQKKGYSAVVRGEEVPKLGYWYRIYVGPLSSLKVATLKSDELKKRGMTKYTAIYAKDSLIRGDLPRKSRSKKRKAAAAPTTKRKTRPSVAKKPQPKVKAKKDFAPPPPSRAKSVVKEKPLEAEPTWRRRGLGRNLNRGNFSLAYQHTYREVKTEVTDRKRITDGTTETDVSVSGSEKNKFDTDMHLDMLRVGFGLTDFLEVFGDVGTCYDDLDDINLAYGGGARLNLFEVKKGVIRGLYSALQGEYHKGKLEVDYQSVSGNRFSKQADWWEFVGRGELGFTRKWFSLYLGGTYFTYTEDTDREQLENIPAPFSSVEFEDDLEEENNFGAYGGLSLNLTPGLIINVEGQILDQNSIEGKLEYRF